MNSRSILEFNNVLSMRYCIAGSSVIVYAKLIIDEGYDNENGKTSG